MALSMASRSCSLRLTVVQSPRQGRLSGSTLLFDQEYGPAVEAFQAGRVTVFALDTTNADSHTLEAGLISVAEDTGGTYAKTNLFPELALEQLTQLRQAASRSRRTTRHGRRGSPFRRPRQRDLPP